MNKQELNTTAKTTGYNFSMARRIATRISNFVGALSVVIQNACAIDFAVVFDSSFFIPGLVLDTGPGPSHC